MDARSYHFLDRVLGEIDNIIKTLSVTPTAARARPTHPEDALSPAERSESARLMRVNHAGEVAAQALYHGQALTARRPDIKAAMQHAAREEQDHLAWCGARIDELGGRPSRLNPFWYAGSFAIGTLAGAIGDTVSLGFLEETEAQVEAHLTDHLGRLSPKDQRSRVILEQMREDEVRHGRSARGLGAAALPTPVIAVMRACSRLMTRGAYWI
jgi:ubiquinone biosynthesis monooxygenase Coq7